MEESETKKKKEQKRRRRSSKREWNEEEETGRKKKKLEETKVREKQIGSRAFLNFGVIAQTSSDVWYNYTDMAVLVILTQTSPDLCEILH